MRQITPVQYREWQETGHDHLLVDVREVWEHESFSIGGTLMPMGELPARLRELPRDKDVVLYCEKGIRSVIAIQRLEQAGFSNLINLSGGMKAWRESL